MLDAFVERCAAGMTPGIAAARSLATAVTAHNLRCRGGRIVEHVVWCAGLSDAETARQVFESGEIQRL